MKLAAQLATKLDLPAGVVINRDGVGDAQVDEFCQNMGIPILMRIPLDRDIGAGIAQGKPLVQIQSKYQDDFQNMFVQIRDQVAQYV